MKAPRVVIVAVALDMSDFGLKKVFLDVDATVWTILKGYCV